MRAWFDFTSLDLSSGENPEHVQESTVKIWELIEDQIDQGIDSTRIVLAGFSQGGVIALLAGLGCEQPLGGVIALSTYIPEQCELIVRQHIPVIQCHGIDDTVIPYEVGLATSQRLRELLGDNYEWHSYPMEHDVNEQEISDLAEWVQNRLGTPITI